MSPDDGTVGHWDSRKIYDLCFILSQIFGTVGRWDTRKTCSVWLSTILVLHSLCPQMLGQWDSGTAAKHITCGTVGRWDTKKHVQLGCQSILVLHSLCPQMMGRWDIGTAGKFMICVLFCPKYLGLWDGGTQEKHVQFGCLLYLCYIAYVPRCWDSGTVVQQQNI